MNRLLRNLFMGVVLAALLAPLVVLAGVSLKELLFPPRGFSLGWYAELLTQPDWLNAVRNSLIIAFGSAALALTVAFPLAYFLWRYKVAYARVLFGLGIAPFMLPPVITALGFLLFWVNAGMYGQMPATLISHAIFFVTLPLVTISLGLESIDKQILEAAKEHKADAIGMSGLLVKSTVVMKENLELMSQRGLTVPTICGGAALNRAYVEDDLRAAYATGPVYYGADAFAGLHIMDELTGRSKVKTLTAQPAPEKRAPQRRRLTRADKEKLLEHAFTEYADSGVAPAERVPEPPFWGAQVVSPEELDLGTVLQYVNKKALFRLQWQYRQGKRAEDEYKRFIQEQVEPRLKEWIRRVKAEKLLEPRVVYGWWPCFSERNSLVVLDPGDRRTELCRFDFPRQPGGKRLCLSDFFRRRGNGGSGDGLDVVGFSLVTMGAVATRTSERLFKENRYDEYLHFHGLSVEGAEGLAEYWHKRMRQQLGIADQDATDIEDLFKQKYQGSRYSFGYPACPNLEDQTKLLQLVKADRIGVVLSEEFQLVPEQSTSAIVCHHPAARYFNVTVTQ